MPPAPPADPYGGLYDFRRRDYAPGLGRWTQLDSSGFEAGDKNLYRYVGNAPTVYGDPSGLLGLFFGESGQTASDRDPVVPRLYRDYDGRRNGQPFCHPQYPWYHPPIPGMEGYVKGLAGRYALFMSTHRWEPLDVFGYSRGAVVAVMFAEALQKDFPFVKIRFMGLIDPVSTFIFGVPSPLDVYKNVEKGLMINKWPWWEKWWTWLFSGWEWLILNTHPVHGITEDVLALKHMEIGSADLVLGFLKGASRQANPPVAWLTR